MNSKNLVKGEYYRHKDHPSYGYAKFLEIVPPKKRENTTNFILAKVEWMVNKNDSISIVKYFKPSDLLKGT